MSRLRKNRIVLGACSLLALPTLTLACGPWLPNRLLDNGGKIILDVPEFYFELEVKQIAQSQLVEFKVNPPDAADLEAQTGPVDVADFSDAIVKGIIIPSDSTTAKMEHERARDYIDSAPSAGVALPDEFPSEFADYHRGALAYKQKRTADAQSAWKALLARPKAERHYRSTWAAYMLARAELDAKNYAAAAKWFSTVRSFTRNGLADSLGLAAASLGWEAYCDLQSRDYDIAAQLYLQQLASGDRSAIESLATVASEASLSETPDSVNNNDSSLVLQASKPILRKVITAYLLSRCMDSWQGDPSDNTLITRWLNILEKAHLKKVEDADRLAWLAYGTGNYDAARQWLKHSDPQSAPALWLSAKLDFRVGKLTKATNELSQAVHLYPMDQKLESRQLVEGEILPSDAITGDLGLLQIARADFLDAFHSFIENNHPADAAYVAERLLTVKELQDLVDKEYLPGETTPLQMDSDTGSFELDGNLSPFGQHTIQMRWLLARRFVRLERYNEARPYFPNEIQKLLDQYTDALMAARNTASKVERATAYWNAAQVARKNGLELMGTEIDPDEFGLDGEFEQSPIALEREKGRYMDDQWVNKIDAQGNTTEEELKTEKPVVVPVSPNEKKRLAQSHVVPEKRWHYRYDAAGLAWKAAQLMPDNDEQTATVLNTAGCWLKDRDDKAADRFYQAIEKRCADTPTGKEAIKRHWFVPLPEPAQ